MVMSLGREGAVVYTFVVRPNTDIEIRTDHTVINSVSNIPYMAGNRLACKNSI